jgi:hypothetical protein
MLDKLPKDILIKLISNIGDEYSNKYLETRNLFELVNNVNGFSLGFYKCCDKSCREFCFVDPVYCKDKLRIITSENTKVVKMSDGDHHSTALDINCEKYNFMFCGYCDKWACSKHWKDCARKNNWRCDLILQRRGSEPNPKIFVEIPTFSLNNLTKDILIKLIPDVENYYKNKYLEMKKLFEKLCQLGKHRLENHKCQQDSCKEICYIYDKTRDDPESGEDLIATSQTKEADELNYILINDGELYDQENDGELYDQENDDYFNSYGIFCGSCRKWFCANHWKESIDIVYQVEKDEGMKLYFCKFCNEYN